MNNYDEQTKWWCERCKASGMIQYAKGESVYDVLYLLQHCHDDHDLARLSHCQFDTSVVRVQAVESEKPVAEKGRQP